MPSPSTTAPSGLRTYPWQGRDLISATSLRQMIGTPMGLVAWQNKEVAAKAIDESDELAQKVIAMKMALDKAHYSDADAMREGTIKWLAAGAYAKRDAAANRGRTVHAHVENGTPLDDVEPALLPFVRAEREAMDTLGITPLLREKTVVNLTLGYAGSFDLIGMKDGVYTLIDVKTGSTGYIDHAIQLALYYWGEFIGHDDVIDEEATEILRNVTQMGILHLMEDGTWEYLPVPITEALGKAVTSQAYLANFYAQFPLISNL